MAINDGSRSGNTSGTSRRPHPVIFLPGIVLPAALRYDGLVNALGDSVHALIKDLEVYAADSPPENYSVELEVEGVSRAADEAGFDRFHLYGHSGGGACALAYAAIHPERLLSLALDEPASDFSPEIMGEMRREMELIGQLPENEQMGAFVAYQLAPGVTPPPRPDGPPPEWMANRPAGINAITSAFERFDLPTERLRAFRQPVYFSYGSLSNPQWAAMRDRLERLFPNFTSERYEGLHHFNTSHVAEPDRVAASLIHLWSQAETALNEAVSA